MAGGGVTPSVRSVRAHAGALVGHGTAVMRPLSVVCSHLYNEVVEALDVSGIQ